MVHKVIEKARRGIFMNRVREIVEAAYAYKKGLTGAGIGVAVLDSGIDASHPDLRNKLVYSYNYLNHTKEMGDDCGHGTHVSGIIGGTGKASGGRYQGLMPHCHFVSLKVLDEQGNGNSYFVIQALHWLLEHGKQYDVRIINISVGGAVRESEMESELLKAVEEVWDAGFIVCAAAGNQGPAPQSITIPGTSPKIITVGSSDEQYGIWGRGGKKVYYSGRGPTLNCICKPDVVAPGAELISCNTGWKKGGNAAYITKSGTSMATPVVSGCIGLLLSQEPALSNKEVKLRLCNSCLNLGFPKNQQGWGMVNVPKLLNREVKGWR